MSQCVRVRVCVCWRLDVAGRQGDRSHHLNFYNGQWKVQNTHFECPCGQIFHRQGNLTQHLQPYLCVCACVHVQCVYMHVLDMCNLIS